MTKNKYQIENLEALLARVKPATRTSNEDSAIAGTELRRIARECGYLGGLVDGATGKFKAEFLEVAL